MTMPSGGRPWHRNPFLWAFLAGIVMLTAIRPFLRRVPDPPPVTGTLPQFSLRDQDGRGFGTADLRGFVHVAAPLTTPCEEGCRETLAGMRRLEEAWRGRGIDRIRPLILAIETESRGSGDPREELRRAVGEPVGWTVLTGTREEVDRTARALFGPEGPEGSGASEAEDPGRSPPGRAEIVRSGGPLAHPFAIIDVEGRLRGRYGSDPLGLDEVYNRAQHVLKEAER